MKKIVVGISGLNAIDNPGPGVGVARSLRDDPDLDVTIIGLAYNALEPGIYMDWVVDRSFTLPYPSSSAPEYLARLEFIREQTGLDCVIPCLDAELPLYIRYADELRVRGIRTCLPTMSQFRLRAKDRLQEVATSAGLLLPRTRVVGDEDGLHRALEEFDYPLLVKGIYYEARKAFTPADAVAHYRHLMAEWGGPVLVQEIVPGEELNVIGAGDGKGSVLGLVGVKKTVVTALGKMWGGITVRHPAMLEAAERFVQEHCWQGPFELECIVEGDDIYLIEINPRFPAWVYFASAVGVNLPARLLREMFGRPGPRETDYDAGQLFVRYSYEMVASLDRFQKVITAGQTP
jgi:carbamoyl-phosphate synthase large subunit